MNLRPRYRKVFRKRIQSKNTGSYENPGPRKADSAKNKRQKVETGRGRRGLPVSLNLRGLGGRLIYGLKGEERGTIDPVLNAG